ncbi:MAG: ABC transporter ATP-binding protein [Anaeroplasmataceae bacterium]
MENIIEIRNLFKSFGDVKAVNDISFKVKKGEFFAFLGINGAGKSTTISIMCGQLLKDSGEVYIDGSDISKNDKEIKGKIGVVFQNSLLDKDLSVYDNLKYRALLYNIHGEAFNKKLSELTNMFDLDKLLKKPLKTLSGGQKRKVDIVRALFHDPKILILDEPTTGLDPQTRKNVWDVLHRLRIEKGLTIFLTTHYMEEADDADYVVILDSGKIVGEGTPYQLKNNYTNDYITLYNVKENDLEKLNLKYSKIKDGYRIEVSNTNEAKKMILEHPDIFEDFEIVKGKMDDVFLNITGKKLVGGNE